LGDYEEPTMADVNEFFVRLQNHYTSAEGSVVEVCLFTNSKMKALPGVFVVTDRGTRKLIFDSTKWKPKAGMNAFAFDRLVDTMHIILPSSQARNGEDLPQICSDSLEPTEGSDVVLTADMKTRFTIWLCADFPG